MKWDTGNKERLYGLLWDKFQRIKSSDTRHAFAPFQPTKSWGEMINFLDEFGIERVRKEKKLRDRVSMTRGRSLWMKLNTQTPARSKDCIIIFDPWWGQSKVYPKLRSRGSADGLSVPKEVAEKFLILGVP